MPVVPSSMRNFPVEAGARMSETQAEIVWNLLKEKNNFFMAFVQEIPYFYGRHFIPAYLAWQFPAEPFVQIKSILNLFARWVYLKLLRQALPKMDGQD